MPSPLIQEILSEFREKFVKQSVFGVSIGAIDSFAATGEKQVFDWLSSSLTRVREVAIKQGQREAINFISNEEGWEESRKFFLKHFGLQ